MRLCEYALLAISAGADENERNSSKSSCDVSQRSPASLVHHAKKGNRTVPVKQDKDSPLLRVFIHFTHARHQPHIATVWTVGVNIYPKENDLPLLFAPTNICPLGCLDGGLNVELDERGRAGPTTNLLPF
jgi:hypothetical protein